MGARSGRAKPARPYRRTSGSPAAHRALWREIYEKTPHTELPWFDAGPSPPVVRAVEEGFLSPRWPVLDIGCGAGSNVLYLRQKGFESHGVDISPGAVRAANRRLKEAGFPPTVREGDALSLGGRAGRFGGAIDHGCFHVLPVDHREAYANEIARILRPGGRFVLTWVAREHTGPVGPPHRPSLAEIAQALETRFQILRTEFQAESEETGPPFYHAWLTLRSAPQPPPR